MKTVAKITLIGCLMVGWSSANLATAADATSIDYGTVQSVSTVKTEGTAAGGAMAGGIAGAVIGGRHHRGLRVVTGAVIGGSIQKHHTAGTMARYSVLLMNGTVVIVDTEQEDMRVDDCVAVEQGKYANIRRVSSVNCEATQQQIQQHHVDAANSCQLAKDELNQAETDDQLNMAVTKVRTLCED